MNDLIDRQDAIDRFNVIRPVDPKKDEYTKGIDVGIAMCIVAVKDQPTIQPEKAQLSQEGTTKDTTSDQPTIQPEERTEKRTETHACDLISRQAAIDAVGLNSWAGSRISNLPSVQPEPQWISVTERLPDNADHPGAFCPRYQVVTPYGVTEGWYRPHDHEKGGQWFALFWFMSQIYEIWNIDFERGDVPKVIGEAPVMEWRPMPEPYKPNK